MQRLTFLSLALIMGLCLQPLPLFAQDQVQNAKDSKEAGDSLTGGKKQAPVTKNLKKGTQQRDASRSDKSQGKLSGNNTAVAQRSTATTKRNTKVAKQSDRQTNQSQSQRNQSATVAVQGTLANHYNGQWVAASTHSDWNVNSNHNWNNREYRYYQGGWLIIDTGWPGDDETGVIVIRVKQSLARQGYYQGHFSETVGPRTRQAISNYESDKGLQVNGQIDGPLLASLGLE